ncbi:AraC family transcriptional regulator [Microbispora bryophytorum]|uniref:AraC family transcriptional regulator n=1 Tax=Microbispora bryophytorum subsp. camponoti TaxID=1677852 RepID=A0ABR8L1I6_9ACTN|nr:AraC family transcriptional regulator [Microbispora camponoti]MBD3142576.1 AraC family transcriptional regulator [Microbispora camponoti]
MDPLEDVLALLGTRAHLSTGMTAGGSWAVRFEPPDGVKFNTLRRGRCLLNVEGLAAPIPLAKGDCFLLTHPLAFTLFSDPDAVPVDAGPLWTAAGDRLPHVGDGVDTFLVGGRFSFGDRARGLLLDGLPPVIHVPADTDEASAVRWALGQIDAELRGRPIGSTLVAEHLAVVMLIHVLRLHLAREPRAVSGWLAGLADPVVAAALRSIHARPAHPWTVAELARAGAVSRSTLAARFKDTVGLGPLDYLTRWRIELASQRLRVGDDTLATIAFAVGYGSESALSTAFKRITGSSPREYRRQRVDTPAVVASPSPAPQPAG